MGSADNGDTEVSEAGHKNVIKDGYRVSNKVNYIPLMLRWETPLFHIKSRVSILRYMIEAAPLSAKPDTYRKLLMGDSYSCNKPIPSLNPRMNGVMKKRNTIAHVAVPNDVIMSEFIQSPTSYFAAIQMDPDASCDLRDSGSRESWILHQNIPTANSVTVTLQQHNNPDAIIFQKARCVDIWRGPGYRFDHMLIHED
ncbi:hypothetical protein K440DRAFT_646462 [Wilcoxina mikolae CBS 423.85]|nr:hypothetical protein K440DRAFT_646462 [Wilcoxina mikolae CBS 423.85]